MPRKLVYVSYRIGNKVFWTKHKLALRKGEAMLSDGTNMARTRCGNRISVLPVRPNALGRTYFVGTGRPGISSHSVVAVSRGLFGSNAGIVFPVQSSHPVDRGPPSCQLRRFFLCRAAGELLVTRIRLLRLLAVEVAAAAERLGVAEHLLPGSGSGPGAGNGSAGGTPGGGGPGGGGGTLSRRGTPPPPVGVPEPGTAALVLIGLSAAAMRARRKRKAC